MAFIIKSFHSPGRGQPNRVFFWQTPWVFRDPDSGDYYEAGGWQTNAYYATKYLDQNEAENVNNIRMLLGRVEELRLTDNR